MDQDQSSIVPDAARFDSTRWTVVLEAGQSRAPGGPGPFVRAVLAAPLRQFVLAQFGTILIETDG
jgi:hypothetical protein